MKQTTHSPVVKNHLVWAIVSIFLCAPIAIPAVLYAVKANMELAQNNIAAAEEAAAKAKKWCVAATIVFAVYFVLILIPCITGIVMVAIAS